MKKNKRYEAIKASRRHFREHAEAFLKKRGVPVNKASRLIYCISIMANFLVYRAIKDRIQLPPVNPDEGAGDVKRVEATRKAVEKECIAFNIGVQDIMDGLVHPMAEDESFIEPILRENYEMLESFVSSGNFRETTEDEIDNPEAWGDSLTHYADRKEDYFETVRKLFALDLEVVRSSLDMGMDEREYQQRLEIISKDHRVDPEDFQRLRRRATEFLRVAFANYLDMGFQPVREEVDAKILLEEKTE